MTESTDPRLLSIVRRVRMLSDDIKALQDDRREVFAEAKAAGYDLPTLRAAIKRMDLSPAERAEADAMLETYEAAIAGEAGAVVQRSGAAELAARLLAEQLEGIEDSERAARVVDHVLALLDLRAEIAVLRDHEKNRRALAEQEGFQPKQLALVVRWYEKCAKHGVDMMKAGEQVFNAYRATVDQAGDGAGGAVRPEGGAPTADEKLAALFAKPAPKPPTAKNRAIADALALARIGQARNGSGKGGSRG